MRLPIKWQVLAVILSLPLLGAQCSTANQSLTGFIPKEVLTPVAVPCSPKLGDKPEFKDSDEAIATASGDELSRIYRAARAQHYEWEGRLETALAGCARVPAPPTALQPNS